MALNGSPNIVQLQENLRSISKAKTVISLLIFNDRSRDELAIQFNLKFN
jgi:hypothetical protein